MAATSGDQIAQAVGPSARTIRRHVRSEEGRAEPIAMQSEREHGNPRHADSSG
ncbi:hypothetical protein [Streptomyces sp. NPDC058701]|uniref:hypothetical protein n=1 Tax=Streptomyces sp. NPDC058701 TaxID=3346608 RepID=UPI00364A1338